MMYQRNPEFLSREVSGECVIIPVNAQAYANKLFMLNETGAYLWALLEKPMSRKCIIDSVRQRYDLDTSDDFEQEIIDFLEVLQKKGFIYYLEEGDSENE